MTYRHKLSILTLSAVAVLLLYLNYHSGQKRTILLLPDELKEVSGISHSQNPHELVMVNDELGIVYTYNYRDELITNRVEFAQRGDYEAIEQVGNTVYVLRSDGIIYEITTDKLTNEYDMGLDIKEFEGMTYNSELNSLIVAAKSKSTDKDTRELYSFDLQNKQFETNPIISIHKQELLESLEVDKLKFNPSAITYASKSNYYYILSSKDSLLVTIDQQGKLLDTQELDTKLFPKPEGIVFDPQNDSLLITSEGIDGDASLVRVGLGGGGLPEL